MANRVEELTRAGDIDGLCEAIDHYVHDRSERLPIPEGKIDRISAILSRFHPIFDTNWRLEGSVLFMRLGFPSKLVYDKVLI